MKNVKINFAVILIAVFSFSKTNIQAQFNNPYKNYVEIGIVGGHEFPKSALAGVYGCFGFNFKSFNRPSAIDIRAKELYYANPEMEGTVLTFTYRLGITKGLYAGIGGAHGHQIDFDEFLTHPISAIGGNNTHIMHSSGYNLELDYNFNPIFTFKKGGSLYPNVMLSYTQLFMMHHTMPDLALNFGIKYGFKKLTAQN